MVCLCHKSVSSRFSLRLYFHLKNPPSQGKELIRTNVPESAKAAVEKIAGALCVVDESSYLCYTVALTDKIYNGSGSSRVE